MTITRRATTLTTTIRKETIILVKERIMGITKIAAENRRAKVGFGMQIQETETFKESWAKNKVDYCSKWHPTQQPTSKLITDCCESI